MFETTIDTLFESPETVIALLPALYITGKAIRTVRRPLKYSVVGLSLLGLFPVFVLFVVGALTKAAAWTGLGTDLFRFEASVAAGVVRFYDALLASWLRVFALVVDSLLSISLFQPDAWTAALHTVFQSWLLVFVLHFASGVVLVYGLYRGIRITAMDSLLRVGGAMLLLAGVFVVLLQDRVTEFGSPEIGVLLVAVIGLEMGVAAILVGVKPDFSGGTDGEFDDDGSVMSDLRTVVSRLEAYAKRLTGSKR